ncbi:MAG: hypothetical protein CVT59_08715 [Actinobacteria bacterium HGW-Actinobacteria-1]|nr:MAG: hypothetical protein CVT59_08715 [Actinobacteria bacterium HGW-Actinobacteria-1]
MTVSLPTLLESLRQLVANPTSNIAAASLALAVAVVFVLIIAVIIMIFIVRPTRSRTETPTEAGSEPQDSPLVSALRRRRGLVIALLGVVAIAATYISSSSNSYCSDTCHSMQDAAATWRTGAHEESRCVSCHETSVVDAAMTRTRHLVASISGHDTLVVRARVSSLRCLACHKAILNGTATSDRGIIVEHGRIITAGMECLDCHASVGHGSGATSSGVMRQCMTCHDGERALNACFVCHEGDPSMAAVSGRDFGTVTLPSPRCDGCHAAP